MNTCCQAGRQTIAGAIGREGWPDQPAYNLHRSCFNKDQLTCTCKIANALHTSVDKLLSDSIQDSKSHLMEDVQKFFADCAPDKVYVMPDIAAAVKHSIRVRKLKRMDTE